MLEQDITQKRKDRHHITQEDFTPPEVIDILFKDIPQDLYTDFSKTFCDPCAGIGNIICFVLSERLKYCKSEKDIINALSTLYGVELMEDNVDELKDNIRNTICLKFEINNFDNINNVINNNFVCSDFFEWDFENWRSTKITSNVLF